MIMDDLCVNLHAGNQPGCGTLSKNQDHDSNIGGQTNIHNDPLNQNAKHLTNKRKIVGISIDPSYLKFDYRRKQCDSEFEFIQDHQDLKIISNDVSQVNLDNNSRQNLGLLQKSIPQERIQVISFQRKQKQRNKQGRRDLNRREFPNINESKGDNKPFNSECEERFSDAKYFHSFSTYLNSNVRKFVNKQNKIDFFKTIQAPQFTKLGDPRKYEERKMIESQVQQPETPILQKALSVKFQSKIPIRINQSGYGMRCNLCGVPLNASACLPCERIREENRRRVEEQQRQREIARALQRERQQQLELRRQEEYNTLLRRKQCDESLELEQAVVAAQSELIKAIRNLNDYLASQGDAVAAVNVSARETISLVGQLSKQAIKNKRQRENRKKRKEQEREQQSNEKPKVSDTYDGPKTYAHVVLAEPEPGKHAARNKARRLKKREEKLRKLLQPLIVSPVLVPEVTPIREQQSEEFTTVCYKRKPLASESLFFKNFPIRNRRDCEIYSQSITDVRFDLEYVDSLRYKALMNRPNRLGAGYVLDLSETFEHLYNV